MDSHADTWIVGRNSLMVEVTDDYVDLTPFVSTLGSMSRKSVGTHALAYDCPMCAVSEAVLMNQRTKVMF